MTPLDADRLAAALPASVEVHPALDSTQARAKALALEGAVHGTAVFAESQPAGRGRLGRVWEGGSGTAVLVTVVVRPAVPASRAPLLCLGAAVAVAEAIGPGYGIKWPNDVLAPDGRKVAGILAEGDPGPDGSLRFALLGVGLNVHAAPPLATATFLEDVDGRPRDRTALAAALVSGVVRWTDQLVADSSMVLAAWRRHQVTLGRRVRIGGIEGEAVDIEPTGGLRIRDDRGVEQVVTTGDVEMVGRA